MPVEDTSEQLVELLRAAARTPGGEVGLLGSAHVARILGCRRDWVHRNAKRLGGFRLPGSDEWRFSPQGVASGLLAGTTTSGQAASSTTRPRDRRLAYPPAKQTLADRPRRPRRAISDDTQGAADGASGTRQR